MTKPAVTLTTEEAQLILDALNDCKQAAIALRVPLEVSVRIRAAIKVLVDSQMKP